MALLRDLLSADPGGWRMAGPGGFRRIADDLVESHGGPGLWWYAPEVFEDFVLTVSWRVSRIDDNSGVFVRCPSLSADPQPAIEHGYEVQIDDRGLDPDTGQEGSPLHLTGAIYRLAPATRLLSRPVGDWNTFEIAAAGRNLLVKLNGTAVSRLDDGTRQRRGHVGLQNHHAGAAVQFQDLRIEHL